MIPQLYECFQHWAAEGTVWVYSDPHFNDGELEKYGRISDEEQVKRINSKVGKKDTIIFLGDIGDVSFIRQIRGRKILITGNHDAGASNYKREKREYYFDISYFTREEAIAQIKTQHPYWAISIEEEHDISKPPFHYWKIQADNKLFDEVYTGPLFIGEKLLLSHEPINFSFALNLHGHAHNGHAKTHHINCCSNIVNYEPISLNKICKEGFLKNIDTIHRDTIDAATERKTKREKKKGYV